MPRTPKNGLVHSLPLASPFIMSAPQSTPTHSRLRYAHLPLTQQCPLPACCLQKRLVGETAQPPIDSPIST